MKSKLTVLAIVLLSIVTLDLWTKSWALSALADGNSRPDFLGGWVPLTLVFNRGAAFGLSIGEDPRLVFIPITVLALILLTVLFIQAEKRDHLRILALSLVISGALGNLYDRIRWDRGVVDFIGPIDLGFMDWPIFNVADSAITCGAVLLATSFWLEGRKEIVATAGGEAGSSETPVPETSEIAQSDHPSEEPQT